MKRTANLSPTSIDNIAERLEGVTWKSDGSFTALCPAHDDTRNSLSVSEGEKGKILYHCHSGCTFEEIVACINDIEPRSAKARKPKTKVVNNPLKPLRFVRSEKNGPNFERLCGGRPQHVHEYRDQQDRLTGYVVRFKDKRFHQITPWQKANGRTVWRVKDFSHPRPLYGLEDLGASDDEPVLVVEGEKAADAARELFPSHVVLTWHGGANAARKSDWSSLMGCEVTIWPDADDPGLAAADDIARTLRSLGVKSVKIVDLPDILPKGWDLADDVPEGVDIEALLSAAKPSEENLTNFLISAKQLAVLDIPPREMLIAPLIATNSVNMIFAYRGTGKTWVALAMAKAVALGEDFLAYHVPKARHVLFIDGEMPLADLKERVKDIGADDIDNLDILSSEILHHEFRSLNINREEDQRLITSMLDQMAEQGRKPDLIIMDNLSSLRLGAEENDNSALDAILPWLVALRHKGYATLLIHHAGKMGDQRGASRLEDPLDTTIKLTPAEAPKGDGAAVNMTFTKTRSVKPNPAYLTMNLIKNEDGILEWDYGEVTKIMPQDHTLRIIHKGPAGDGSKRFAKQKELVDAVGLKAPAISKHLSALRHDEMVDKKSLTVTEKGLERLRDIFPDEDFE
jgi:hypothetical protein